MTKVVFWSKYGTLYMADLIRSTNKADLIRSTNKADLIRSTNKMHVVLTKTGAEKHVPKAHSRIFEEVDA